MSKLMSLIRRAPKRFAALTAMLLAAIIVPAVVFAWGPDRPTYTVEHPADHNTFNSITNNPDYGDERNFVRIKDAADTGPGNWKDEITVEANKEYLVQMYVHNNAADNLNLVAKDTRVMANVPNNTAKQIQIDGFVTSSNATPNKIWDQAIFKSEKDFNLTYVAGSAILYNNHYGQTGAKLSDSIVTSTGALVGYDKLDGNIPGCFKYSGYVSFKVKAQVAGTLNFTMSKLVSEHGKNTWVDDYTAKPGETVDYLIQYRNIGDTQQDNVIMRDKLPAHTSYVNGSTVVGNSKNPGGATAGDGITKDGLNIGSYAPNGNAWAIFSAKIDNEADLPCGDSKLVNTAHLSSSGYYKEDTANVTVKKECKPEAKYKCDTLNVQTISRSEFKFTTQYTAENATFKGVTYVIRDASGTVIATETTTGTTYTYKQEKAGKYTVQATVTFEVDGQLKTATSEGCKSMFEVPEQPKDIVVCDLTTFQIVTIKESDFNPEKYSKDLEKCKNIKVCELATKQIVTIKAGEFDSSKYSKDLKDCETPETMTVCDLTTKQIVTINKDQYNETKYTTDLSKCEETPVTPPELPTTGIGENIAAIVGLGALIASLGYYIASRRALNQ